MGLEFTKFSDFFGELSAGFFLRLIVDNGLKKLEWCQQFLFRRWICSK